MKMLKHGIALVVSSSNYNDENIEDLPCCNKDGNDIAKSLRLLGFDVLTVFDETRDDLLHKIIEFSEVLSLYQTCLFYYSGHGLQIDGINYIVPRDTKLVANKEILIRTGLIDIDLIISGFQVNTDKTNLVILDACRNNPFISKGFTSSGLAEMRAGVGTLISYATSPNSTSVGYKSPKVNSLFTKYLLEHINTPNLKIEDMFKLIRIDVENDTEGNQIPWENTSLKGNFYFITKDEEVITEEIYSKITNSLAEAKTLIELSKIYALPIANILLKYSYYKMNLPGGIYLSEASKYNLALKRVLELGFVLKNYRWYYNGHPVRMGEFLHNVPNLKSEYLKILIEYSILIENKDRLIIKARINVPDKMKFGCTLFKGDGSRYTTDFKDVDHGELKFCFLASENLSDFKGQFKIEIFSIADSKQPNEVKKFVGKYGENIEGDCVLFDSINNYQIKSKQFLYFG